MGVPATDRPFAAFCCRVCGHIFAGGIPAIFEDLPGCPICFCESQIHSILDYIRWRQNE